MLVLLLFHTACAEADYGVTAALSVRLLAHTSLRLSWFSVTFLTGIAVDTDLASDFALLISVLP